MYDQALSNAITAAFSRLRAEMERAGPFMAEQTLSWIGQLFGGAQPEDYFKHPFAFPMLLLPWWLEKAIRQDPDISFQSDLVYSTIDGYYFIRLIDNLIDREATVELELLPVLAFFHIQLQRSYHRLL